MFISIFIYNSESRISGSDLGLAKSFIIIFGIYMLLLILWLMLVWSGGLGGSIGAIGYSVVVGVELEEVFESGETGEETGTSFLSIVAVDNLDSSSLMRFFNSIISFTCFWNSIFKCSFSPASF